MRFRRVPFVLAVVGTLLVLPQTALAEHCPPSPGLGDNWCHDVPQPSAPPPTPKPTPKPTAKPTAAPTKAPVATKRPSSGGVSPTRTRTPSTTATQAPIELESSPVVTLEPPEAVFPDELDDGILEDETQDSASVTTWIFGFIVGFLLGALIGRASWGFSRRRRRQQIFG